VEAAKLVKKPKASRHPKNGLRRRPDKAARLCAANDLSPANGIWSAKAIPEGSGTFTPGPSLRARSRAAFRELAHEGDIPRMPEEILALKV
jgi:hypothetical protein